MLQAGYVVGRKYRILQTVGIGGMSVVYLAEDIKNRKKYAIKNVERDGRNSDHAMVIQSLAAEGNMLKQLSNPHLPAIYDIIEAPESFMLVMDYVEGENLDKVVKERGAQTEHDIYNWGIQICDVLEYLHGQTPPIIYRDMKPSNIILQSNGNIVLIDFGTARTEKLEGNMSSDTICIGTAGFAAPEQYGGFGQSDARTDIYCLGATLYNLLTGHSPCEPPEGIQPLECFDAALVNSPLDQIIRKCTQGAPGLRYQSAADVRAALESAQNGKFETQKLSGASPWIWQMTKRAGDDTTGLSGLLIRKDKRRLLTDHTDVEPRSETLLEDDVWQEDDTFQENRLLQRIMITLLVSAMIFLAVSAVFIWLNGRSPAIIALCLALVSIVLACLSLLAIYRPNIYKRKDR